MSGLAELNVPPASTAGPEVRLRRVTPTASTAAVLILAATGLAARLPFLARPLTSDEGGFLLVASQWAPGTSLYGDYWVDRPPLLITLFQVIDRVGGGPVALRLVGATFVGISVLLAAALGKAAIRPDDRPTPHHERAPICAAAVATVFLATPAFGAPEVDGELLAMPFVLGGLVAVFRAAGASSRGAGRWWAAAGVLAVSAAAVKQNMLEVFVAATVVILVRLRHSPAATARAVAAFGGAAAATTTVLVGWAALHGTSAAALWDAIATFRLEASGVIARSAPPSTHGRALDLATAFLVSGALGIVVVGFVPRLRHRAEWRPTLLGAVATSVLAWELFGVVAGGSYWLHYLLATVPGLVLAACLAVRADSARVYALGAALIYAGVVAAAAVVTTAVTAIGTSASDTGVEHYLSVHERPGDTGVVAFGNPALLQAAHLSSPYPELWSLPVRVRDPQLIEFDHVLDGRDAPNWVIVNGDSLATWGVDPTLAEPDLEQRYQLAHVAGDWHIYHLRTEPR